MICTFLLGLNGLPVEWERQCATLSIFQTNLNDKLINLRIFRNQSTRALLHPQTFCGPERDLHAPVKDRALCAKQHKGIGPKDGAKSIKPPMWATILLYDATIEQTSHPKGLSQIVKSGPQTVETFFTASIAAPPSTVGKCGAEGFPGSPGNSCDLARRRSLRMSWTFSLQKPVQQWDGRCNDGHVSVSTSSHKNFTHSFIKVSWMPPNTLFWILWQGWSLCGWGTAARQSWSMKRTSTGAQAWHYGKHSTQHLRCISK